MGWTVQADMGTTGLYSRGGHLSVLRKVSARTQRAQKVATRRAQVARRPLTSHTLT